MLHLIVYLLLEPVKRILSALLYPAVYPFRTRLRNFHVKVWPGYLYEPARGLHSFLLWLFLDDSIRMETGEDCANQNTKYPSWVLALNYRWLRCYWWSAIRNSFVNWNNLNAYCLGEFVSEKFLLGAPGGKNFYITRKFTNGTRPYAEFYIAGRWNQVGWLKGSSRFEIDIMKKRG